MGPSSVNLTQLAQSQKAAILCEIARNDSHWPARGVEWDVKPYTLTHSLKVTDFATHRKPACNLLLVNNTITCILPRTVSELSLQIGQIIAFNRGASI